VQHPQPILPTMSDPISRLTAALADRYRLEGELGAGGMATVYLAADLKHDRKVAIKVLKPELAAVVGADRFLVEIKTTASLHHPHILPLHDSGEADGLLFYVMPYVSGESLRNRLDREHQLAVDDAVRIATGMAEALDYAHRQGVIHRDIKPANVLLQDGKPVISDFGIALALDVAGGGRLTETGLSLGTPHYMSPEQATGDTGLGPATDIWAVGCVLHEMLVGEPPFAGSTPQAVLGKIITGEVPPADAARPSVPPNVGAVIAKALERVPADRFRSGAELVDALEDRGFRHRVSAEVGAMEKARPAGRVVGALTASTVLFALLSAWLLFGSPRESRPTSPERFTLDAPGAAGISSVGISTASDAVVFVGPAAGEGRQLWLRRWNDLGIAPIPGTEGNSPALSPDGTEVAFIAGGELKAVPVSGGVVRTLATAVACCPRWSSDGFVYFTGSGAGTGVQRVLDTGGQPETVTELAPGEVAHYDLQMLRGGLAAVFTVSTGLMGGDLHLEAIRFDTGERTVLTSTTGVHAHVTPTGHLVFGDRQGQILAAPFDVDRMTLTGVPTLIADGVFEPGGVPRTTFDLSPSGRLVYLTAPGSRGSEFEFVWLDREGTAIPVDSALVLHPEGVGWSISPDGARVVFNDVVDGNNDIYLKHLPDGPVERITTDRGVEQRPFWTSDGQRILYFTSRGSQVPDSSDLWSVGADGVGPQLVLNGPRGIAEGASSPGTDWLVLRTVQDRGERPHLLGFRPGVDSAAAPLVAGTGFSENFPAISPDGRWLAYTSDRTGRSEVYVRRLPDIGGGPGTPISNRGGTSPRWAASGTELFFLRSNGAVVATDFDPAAGTAGQRRELFTLPGGGDTWARRVEVHPDGRFLMIRPRGNTEERTPELVVVQNFFEELKRLLPP